MRKAILGILVLGFSACGGGGYSVGGQVIGLQGTVVLQNNGADDKSISADDDFKFSTKLKNGDAYKVTVKTQPEGQTCRVGRGAGTIDGSDVSNITVDCAIKEWTYPFDIDDFISPSQGGVSSSDSNAPAVALNGNGDTIVAWVQFSVNENNIFKAENTDGEWTYPSNALETVNAKDPDPEGGADAEMPDVAISDNGDAIIVWAQSDGNESQIFKAERRGGEWTTPTSLSDNISPNGENAFFPKVAMDANGNAIIVWQQSNGTNYQIYMAEYREGEWTLPEDLDDHINPSSPAGGDDGAFDNFTNIFMSSQGCALVVWQAYNGTGMRGFSSEYLDGVWSHPTALSDTFQGTQLGTNSIDEAPKAFLDFDCNGVEVWKQSDGSTSQMYVRTLTDGTFDEPSGFADRISYFDSSVHSTFDLAGSQTGELVSVWRQDDEDFLNRMFRAERRGGDWTIPNSYSDAFSYADVTGDVNSSPRVGVDGGGEAIVAWTQSDGTNDQVFVSEYRLGAWQNPSSFTDNISPDDNSCSNIGLASSDIGDAVLVWVQDSQLFLAEYR
jgi:hypothetical protein